MFSIISCISSPQSDCSSSSNSTSHWLFLSSIRLFNRGIFQRSVGGILYILWVLNRDDLEIPGYIGTLHSSNMRLILDPVMLWTDIETVLNKALMLARLLLASALMKLIYLG